VPSLHRGLLTSHALHTPSSTLSRLFHTSLTHFHPSAFPCSRPMSAIGPVLALTWCPGCGWRWFGPKLRCWLLAPARRSRSGVSESFGVVVEGGGVTGERGRCATPSFIVVVRVGPRVGVRLTRWWLLERAGRYPHHLFSLLAYSPPPAPSLAPPSLHIPRSTPSMVPRWRPGPVTGPVLAVTWRYGPGKWWLGSKWRWGRSAGSSSLHGVPAWLGDVSGPFGSDRT
jgi:hypothetical protein